MKRIIKEEFRMLNKDVTAKGMDLTKSDLKNSDLQATDLIRKVRL